ncbi:MAG TPA: hypothetical protein PLX69_18495 [Leptospiraceae bacterium]|nr:hypothetical protein [Leptospiraceae bacterium]
MSRLLRIIFFLLLVGHCFGDKKPKIKFSLPTMPSLPTATAVTTNAPVPISKSLQVGLPSGNTNEFGNKATILITMNNEPSDKVYVCLTSSDTTNGGTILISSLVKADTGICNSGTHYLEFDSLNWATSQSFQIVGSRGTINVSGNTNYKIQFKVKSQDVGYDNYSLMDINLTNLDIDTTGFYFVRTNTSGLTGSIQLQNNSVETLTLTENGFNNFPTSIANGSSYSVSIKTQPTGQVCSISNLPYGTSSTNVIIQILCVSGYLFNGTILSSNNPPTLNQSFTGLVTLAGSFPPTVANGTLDGAGTVARFDNPIAITSDGTNIYVADLGNNAIRKISIGTNTVSTLATISSLPHGVATDGVNVYATAFATHTIVKVEIATGTVTTLAGSAPAGDVVGDGASAKFNEPTYLTTDGVNLFVVDRLNNKVKQIVLSTGIVSTVVSGLNYPNGIATDGVNLYIAETGGHQIIKYVIASAMQTIVAGTGASGNADNATGTLAQFNNPYGVTMDGSFLYILEGTGRNLKKMLLASPNSVTTIIAQNDGYSDGAIGSAQFCNIGGSCDSSITFDGSFLYFSDRFNHSIRKLYY